MTQGNGWRSSKEPGAAPSQLLYMSHKNCAEILRLTCKSLGITHYAMAKLLGVRHENYGKWFSGLYRPSSKYFARLCLILNFQANGLVLSLVDHFDWERNEIIYKKGVRDGNGRDNLSQFGWDVQKKEAQAGQHPSDSGAE